MKQAKLREEIEKCRKEMFELAEKHALTSDIVLKASKRLDNLLNLYEQIDAMPVGSYIPLSFS